MHFTSRFKSTFSPIFLSLAFFLVPLVALPSSGQEKSGKKKKEAQKDKKAKKEKEEKKVETLVIYQQSDGFPGTEKQKRRRMIPQKVFIRGNKMVVQDITPMGLTRIVNLDRQVVWELNPAKKIYAETPFSKFEKLAEKREKNREKMMERIENKNLSERKKKKLRRQAGLNPTGGDDVVKLKKTGQTMVLGLYKCERWQILRNSQLILDVWTTEDVKYSPSVLLRFYRQLGLFSSEVVEKTRQIKGFPIRLQVLVDLGMKGSYDITSMVARVKKTKVSPSLFELPQNYKKYEKPKPKKVCPVCNKEVKTLKYRVTWNKGQEIYYCCSQKHQVKWMVYKVKKKKR